jgi:type I restriction enzyme, S subunit
VPRRDQLEPRWFHWITKTPFFWEQCDEKSRGTSGKNRIRPEQFLEIEIPLPSLAEQRRIVARIEELFATIGEARSLRHRAFEEAVALSISEVRRVFSDPSVEWQYLTVEDSTDALIDYRGRTPPISENGIPHLTSANIKNGRIDWRTTKFVSPETYDTYMTRGLPKPGDVIFTMEAPLGDAAVVPDHRPFSLAQRTLLMRPKKDLVTGEYLARVLTSPNVHEDIYSKATGTTVKGIASKRLRHVLLPVPSLNVQRRIVIHLDDFQARLDDLERNQEDTSKELDAFMPSILSKAFSGEP